MGRRTIVLVVAILLAGLASFAVWNFLRNVEAEVKAQGEFVSVFKASTRIPEGTAGNAVIGADAIEPSEALLQDVPEGAVGSSGELETLLREAVSAGPISKGAIITRDMFVSQAVETVGIKDQLDPGMMAISIRVDDVRGVNGFIQPGDLVGMIVTISVPPIQVDVIGGDPTTEQTLEEILRQVQEVQQQEVTKFLLQGLEVLAVGRDVQSAFAGDAARTSTQAQGQQEEDVSAFSGIFTLEVDPEQAERIAFAFEKGSVWLTLVADDFVPGPTEGITRESLFGR